MRNFLNSLFSLLILFLIALSSFVIATTIVISSCFVRIIPVKSWHQKMRQKLTVFAQWWASFNNLLIRSRRCEWDIKNNVPLSTEHWYVLIANHRTWFDILVLGYVFNRKIPLLKFFMKRELLWALPIVGLACWVLDYPFMRRHSRKAIRLNPVLKTQDIETAKKACQKFLISPTTVMNFVEGTRFTPEKHKRQLSPF